jgi:hypothetical protein
MNTSLRRTRSIATQQVVPFTGEGAYHGSSKPRPAPAREAAEREVVEEMRPRSLDRYGETEPRGIDSFTARFTNRCETVATLPAPTQEAIVADGVTFCWCPIDEAIHEAGPLTRSVLEVMRDHLSGRKRYVYIDAKIQYFEPGDVPVDSQHWHVDGSIVARDERVRRLGHTQLHDMRARMEAPDVSPTYLSYQSSEHCATMFVTEPVALTLPELIPDFVDLDRQVRALEPASMSQPAGAVVARTAGWRLWIRCVETDRKVELTTSIIECYGMVYRLPAA